MGSRQQVPRVSTVRLMRCSSHRRGEALAGAPLDNAPKEYPPKIQQLVQDIASLTLLEISDLNELLKVSPAGPGLWGLGRVSCSWCIWGGGFGQLRKVHSLGAGMCRARPCACVGVTTSF